MQHGLCTHSESTRQRYSDIHPPRTARLHIIISYQDTRALHRVIKAGHHWHALNIGDFGEKKKESSTKGLSLNSMSNVLILQDSPQAAPRCRRTGPSCCHRPCEHTQLYGLSSRLESTLRRKDG